MTAAKKETGIEAAIAAAREEMRLAKAPAWNIENIPGTEIIGTVVGTRVGTTEKYGDYPIYVAEDLNGDIYALHAFHTLLQDGMKDIVKGDMFMANYIGRKVFNDETRNDYEDYFVTKLS